MLSSIASSLPTMNSFSADACAGKSTHCEAKGTMRGRIGRFANSNGSISAVLGPTRDPVDFLRGLSPGSSLTSFFISFPGGVNWVPLPRSPTLLDDDRLDLERRDCDPDSSFSYSLSLARGFFGVCERNALFWSFITLFNAAISPLSSLPDFPSPLISSFFTFC